MKLTYTVRPGDEGSTVLSILRRELAVSASLVRRLKTVQGISVDGVPVYTDRRLVPGETVAADVALAEPPCGCVPEDGPLEVLLEDEGYLAAAKPAGLLTHPTHARYTGTLANYTAGYLLAREGSGCCHAVNRLDRDTSGVVLFAKNGYMKERLSAALTAGQKTYLAVAFGRMPEPAGVIDLAIRRESPQNLRRIAAPDGQRAVTRYETLTAAERNGVPLSLLRLELETGRTHQIRVHCAALGCPLLGDRLYGTPASLAASETLGVEAQLLHAHRLAFAHPLTGDAVTVSAPMRDGLLRGLMETIIQIM